MTCCGWMWIRYRADFHQLKTDWLELASGVEERRLKEEIEQKERQVNRRTGKICPRTSSGKNQTSRGYQSDLSPRCLSGGGLRLRW